MAAGKSRRVVVGAALVVAAMLVGGCGGEDEGSGDPKRPPGKVTGTVTVWDWQYSSPTFGKALKRLDREFEAANPGVKVNHVAQPLENYDQLVRAAAAAKEGPDVVMLYPARSGVLSYLSSLEQLNGKLAADVESDVAGLELASRGFDTEEGIYGVPTQTQGVVFYYNKKLFEKAGLDPDAPPTTYDELVEALAQIDAAGITPLGGGNKDGFMPALWFSALWPGVATADDSIALADGDLPFTDARVEDVMSRFLDLVDRGYFRDGIASTPLFPDAVDSFAAGEQAVFLGLASDAASYVQFNEALGERDVGVFQVPGITEDSPNFLPVGPGLVWSVPAYAANKEAAIAYINFVTSASGAQVQFDVGGVLPANSGVTFDDAPSQVVEMYEAFEDQGTFFPPHNLWKADVVADFGKQMQQVLAGDSSLAEALSAVDATQARP